MHHDDFRSGRRRSQSGLGRRALMGTGGAILLGSLLTGTAQAAAVGGGPSAGDALSHPYRHGVVQTLDTNLPGLMGLTNLRYGGGTSGVGVGMFGVSVASARAVAVGGWFPSCGVTVGPVCGALPGMRNRHDRDKNRIRTTQASSRCLRMSNLLLPRSAGLTARKA